MNIQFSFKKIILYSIGALWIIFSVSYIVWDIWSDFRIHSINQAYQSGRTDTISQLINQAENEACQPFSVSDGERRVQLINVACLDNIDRE